MSNDDAPVHPGDILAGKYRVERIVGKGNMGIVVTAVHVELGQRVALKFLLQHRQTNEALRERFLREARAAACLRSQHEFNAALVELDAVLARPDVALPVRAQAELTRAAPTRQDPERRQRQYGEAAAEPGTQRPDRGAGLRRR